MLSIGCKWFVLWKIFNSKIPKLIGSRNIHVKCSVQMTKRNWKKIRISWLTIFSRYRFWAKSSSNLFSESSDFNGSSGTFSDSICVETAFEMFARCICITMENNPFNFTSTGAICRWNALWEPCSLHELSASSNISSKFVLHEPYRSGCLVVLFPADIFVNAQKYIR